LANCFFGNTLVAKHLLLLVIIGWYVIPLMHIYKPY